MKKKMIIGLSASLILSGGLLSSSKASQDRILPSGDSTVTNHQSSLVASSNAGSTVQLANAVKVGTPQSQNNSAKQIAKVQAHKMAGRDAVTLYLKGLPVLTFLGSQSASNTSLTGFKVATAKLPSTNNSADSQSALSRATTLAGRLNQLHRDNFDAHQIRVLWNQDKQAYLIQAGSEKLLSLNEQTIAPNSNRDRAQDALRVTNLLRRQMGNAPALASVSNGAAPAMSNVLALGPVRMQVLGIASWYGPGFHGNLTANGERYNQYAMTAAHKTLPFGTRVRVTNLSNGRSVVVRINDRGPYIHGRELDLSKGAAQMLGITGVARIRMDVLR